MSFNKDFTSIEHLEATNAHARKDLKKSFDDIDKKLRNLQVELTNHKDRSLKDKPNQSTYNHKMRAQTQQSDDNNYGNPFNEHQYRQQGQTYNPGPNPRTISGQSNRQTASTSQLPSRNLKSAQSQRKDLSETHSHSPSVPGQSGNAVQDIKAKLRKIFQFYTTFGDRCNASFLKSSKFHKMMLDSSIRDSSIMTQKRLDLLFVAENKHKPNMDFDTFLQLLTKIGKTKYKGVCSDSEALNHLLTDHLLPLYDNIYNETELGIDEEKLHEEINENCILILKHVCNPLIKIFQVYFPWESQTSQQEAVVKQRSENALFTFLREFDICPALITKSTSYTIWTEILDTPQNKLTYSTVCPNIIPFLERDFGTIFTFSKFCAFLIRTAIIAYIDALGPNARKFSNSERFALLLERMELSTGMLNFERKTSTPHNSKNTLIVPREVLQKIFLPEAGSVMDDYTASKRSYLDDHEGGNRSRSELRSKNGSQLTNRGRNLTPDASSRYDDLRFNEMNKSSRLLRNGSHNNISMLALGQSLLPIFDRNMEQLQRIFQYYCSFGDPLNTKGMKSIKFKKLLKECSLLNGRDSGNDEHSYRIVDNSKINTSDFKNGRTLQNWEADIIFTKLTGHRQLVEMNDKNLPYNKNIKSPHLGQFNHLYKNQSNHVAANGKLEFEGWLVAIEQVAERLYSELDLEQAVQHVIENHILKLDQYISGSQHDQRTTGGQPLKVLVELLKDPDMIQFLSLVHKSVLIYFTHYADSKGLMNFERFVKFCKDFGIFPDIIPKSRIMTFFYTLAAIHSTAEQNESQLGGNGNTSFLKKSMSTSRIMGNDSRSVGQNENELVDQHLFVEALALCAFEIPYNDPQPSDIEKICYLLERMNQSDGPMIVQKSQGHTRSTTGASWDILYFIRKRYPEIFGMKNEEKPRAGFDDLIKESMGVY